MEDRVYKTPFAERYSSMPMLYNFSAGNKFRIWRKLWIALAVAEKKLGLPVNHEQIAQLKKFADKINYADARRFESRVKHDVMAHILAYGKQCPKAKPIIHLGATSAYVVDNTDLILMRDALAIVKKELVNVIKSLGNFAKEYAGLPTVAYTHFQPAQFTTVGKRACLWLNDLVMDLCELDNVLGQIRFLGVKGAVGTQASFLKLFNGNEGKVKKLDELVAKHFGFQRSFIISGQTYTRKLDMEVHSLLAAIAQSASKFANDLRLLQHMGEIEEPFDEGQVGSSAMPYKRNPVKAERITSLARLVISSYQNSAMTASNQWLERSLDDSAGKRVTIPEAFLGVDAILNLYYDIVTRIKVNAKIITSNVNRELPFVASENILMEAVKKGGDRQALHEKIRRYALTATNNDFLEKLSQDMAFKDIRLAHVLKPQNYIGRATSQVKEFLRHEVEPIMKSNKRLLGMKAEVNV